MGTTFATYYARPVARFSTAPIFPSTTAPIRTDGSCGSRCGGWDTDMELACANGEPSVGPAPARTFEPFCGRIIPAPASVSRRRVALSLALAIACWPALRLTAQDSTAR